MAACFRYPDLFLDPKTGCLNAMLRGYSRSDMLKKLPYTVRYLGDYLDLSAAPE